MSTCGVIILVGLSISHRYVRAYSSATLTIRQLGALFKTRTADISVELKTNEFVDDSAVGLGVFSLYGQKKGHSCIAVTITINLVCGRSQSVRF